jgi:hypothetical protein
MVLTYSVTGFSVSAVVGFRSASSTIQNYIGASPATSEEQRFIKKA